MYTCASCTVTGCRSGQMDNLPKNCPMLEPENFDHILEEYFKPENHEFYVKSSAIESAGYCRWPRIREIAEFARSMGYTRLGLAFCIGLHKEASLAAQIFRKQGFEVVSVVCKTGSIPKSEVGIAPEQQLNPDAREVMCNPIAQAMLLNEQKTQFNIALGLCVGHDSMFYKHSDALVTTLVAKDRVTGHSPAAPLYCAESYFRNRNL